MKQYKPSALQRRIVPGGDLTVHSFCAGFLPYARAFVLWSWLDNHHQYRLSLADATERMAQITGFGPAYSGALVRQALGVLWDIEDDGRLHIRYAGTLRQQAAQVLGVRKRSFPLRWAVAGNPPSPWFPGHGSELPARGPCRCGERWQAQADARWRRRLPMGPLPLPARA